MHHGNHLSRAEKLVKINLAAMLASIVVFYLAGCSNAKPQSEFNPNGVSICDQASRLISKAGGANIVCKEASQLFFSRGFTNYCPSHFYIFQESDLVNYPALRSLGNVDGIWSGSPPYIKIHVGQRPEGFYLEIDNTNCQERILRGEYEVVKPCIFVHE